MDQIANYVTQPSKTTKYLAPILQGYKFLHHTILEQYLSALNTELYIKLIKPYLTAQYYLSGVPISTETRYNFCKHENSEKFLKIYSNHVSFTRILTFIICLYSLLSYINILESYWSYFYPTVFGSFAFYLFFVLPFRSTCAAELEEIFFITSLCQCLNLKLIFILVILSLLILRKILRMAVQRFKLKQKLEQCLTLCILLNRVKAGAMFFVLVLNCINLLVSLGNNEVLPEALILNALMIFFVACIRIRRLRTRFLSFNKKIIFCVNKYAVSFCIFAVYSWYLIVFVLDVLRAEAPAKTVKQLYSALNWICYYLFSREKEPFSFIVKAASLVSFGLFCLINEKIRLKKGIGDKRCISEELNIKTNPGTEETVFDIKEYKLLISDGLYQGLYNSKIESTTFKLMATTGIFPEFIDTMKKNESMPVDNFLKKQESISNYVSAEEQETMPLPGSLNKEKKDFIVANADQEREIDEKQGEAGLEKMDFVENKALILEGASKDSADLESRMVGEKEESCTTNSICESTFEKTDLKSDSLSFEEVFSSFNSLASNQKCELVLSTYETVSTKETSDIYKDFDSSLSNDENNVRKKDEDLALEIINTLSAAQYLFNNRF